MTVPGPLNVESLTHVGVDPAELIADGEHLWWVELHPALGRALLMRDGVDVTPAGMSVGSRVIEYGGSSFTAADGNAWFVEAATQRIIALTADRAHRPLTEADGRRYGGLSVDRARGRLVAVCEDHRQPGEAVTSLVGVDLRSGGVSTLAAGRDFYQCPRVSPDGNRLAYMAYGHPGMPFDACELIVSELDTDGAIATSRAIAGGGNSSAGQPVWAPDGQLYFVDDREGWWQLWTLTPDGRPERVLDSPADVDVPVFRPPNFSVTATSVLCAPHAAGHSALTVVDRSSGAARVLEVASTTIRHPVAAAGGIAIIGGSAREPLAVRLLPEAGGDLERLGGTGGFELTPDELPRPETITVSNRHGDPVTARLFLPTGATGPVPLIVQVHGGPVALPYAALTLGIYASTAAAFWTSRGYAFVNVDYHGTLGYGRSAWRRLYGEWGRLDVTDCDDVARELVARGIADPGRVVIRGGSAGGWTTCHAMVSDTIFRAGTAYFPVTDLVSFDALTHKYESRYNASLIGPYDESGYRERSPLTHAADAHGPLLFVQGLDDKVCLPEQALAMHAAMNAAGIRAEILTHEGEGHGFIRAESNSTSLLREAAFYADVLDLPTADGAAA